MTTRPYHVLGGLLLKHGWGCDDRGDIDRRIGSATAEETCVWLLAYIAELLRQIGSDVSSTESHVTGIRRRNEEDCGSAASVSHGMKRAIAMWRGRVLIEESAMNGLSARATTSLWRAVHKKEAEYMSDLTHEVLCGISGCGDKTIEEILKWVENYGQAIHGDIS